MQPIPGPGGAGQQPYWQPRPPGKNNTGMIVLIVVGVCALFFGGCAVLFGMALNDEARKTARNTGTAEEAGEPAPSATAQDAGTAAFKSVRVKGCEVNILGFPEVTGTVVNTATTKGQVRVGFDITDAEGTRIDAAVAYVADLRPGQRGNFTAVALTSAGTDEIVCTLADVKVGS
ncbi:FxLYD domain-containing protein [Actinocorallia longicatena]|uniref:Uncharacterized protein n=1 Tax=Actinocorallia longicatena TaxID=111803 RepID=A0ABP6QFY8_9ACTN